MRIHDVNVEREKKKLNWKSNFLIVRNFLIEYFYIDF